MTIKLYTGTPGSGKSFCSIELITDYLCQKKDVIANFALNFSPKQKKKGWEERFHYWPNETITINNLVEHAIQNNYIGKRLEGQCLVVIDEAGGRFNSRDFQQHDRMEWLDFFSQHAKLGFDFLLVAQMDRMIDRQIRGLIETEYIHRKINNFGVFKFLPLKVFVQVEYWYVLRQRVKAEYYFFRKKTANMYDRYKMFSGFKLSDELLAKIENIQKKVEVSDSPITAIFHEGE